MAWTGNVSPVMRQKSKGTRPLRNKQRAQARRYVRPGFPMEPRAFSLEEIRSYFSGDRIVCLLCGRPLLRLGGHLSAIHQVSEDEYREMFGLPWSRGLTGIDTHENYRNATLRAIEEGKITPGQGVPAGKAFPKNPPQPFRRELACEHIRNVNGPQAILGVAHFEEVVRRVTTGKIVRDVLRDLDIAPTTWRHFMQKRPDLREVLLRAVDTLPFSMQAANHMGMGPRFVAEVRRFRSEGLGDKKIAPKVGVTTMTVFHTRRRHGIE